MSRFVVSRLSQALILLVGVSLLSFAIMLLSPGGPTDIMINTSLLSADEIAAIEVTLGLDQPIPVQYWRWFTRVLQGDFGTSFQTGQPVLTMITERLPATLALNLISMLLIYLIAIPAGVFAALRQNSLFDHCLTLVIFLGQAMPAFWLGLLLIYFVGLRVDWLALSGMATIGVEFGQAPFFTWLGDRLRYMTLPVTVIVLTGLAPVARFMRASMLDVLNQDYIRTARAKGLSEATVVWKHALRNALMPIITMVGITFSILLSGSVVIERVFSWPGVGLLAIDAILNRDYQVVMAFNLIGAMMVVVGGILTDLLYLLADPRIKY